MGLKVAEIEGDAVLFYREGPPPSKAELLEQTRKMFVEFHTHLKRYETLRVCHCDACSTTQNLNIKFVAHYGPIEFIKVHESTKPYGATLITAHRLLKNSIEGSDYLLQTCSYTDFEGVEPSLPAWSKPPTPLSDEFDIGVIEYEYFQLADLLKEVPEAPRPILPEVSKNPIVTEALIPGDLDEVFDTVTDLSLRNKWNPRIKVVEFDEEKLNRQGATHLCLIGSNQFEVETIPSPHASDYKTVRTYGERSKNVPVVGNLSVYYTMTRKPEGTLVRFEAHLPKVSFFKGILLRILRSRFKKISNESLERLKQLFLDKSAEAG